jgi:hypothetical protein
MSLGLFIGSLVVLAIGLLMAAFGYYVGNSSNEEYIDLDSGKNIFKDYLSGNRKTCNDKIRDVGIGGGIILGSGVFVIMGLITSIIFGVKLVMERREKKEEIGDIK